jgi:hypothetical protein
VAALFGAEIIHTAVIRTHFQEWALAGWFFAAVAAAEGVLAFGLIVRPSPRFTKVVVGVSLATVAIWLVSRTWGLPLRPAAGTPESVGRADSVSSLLEVVTAWALLWCPSLKEARTSLSDRHRLDRVVAVAVIIGVAVLTAVAVASPAHNHP